MTKPPDDWRSMFGDEIIESLFSQIYEPPFSVLREDLRSVPEVLRIPIPPHRLRYRGVHEQHPGFLKNYTGR